MRAVRCALCTTITLCSAGSTEYSHVHGFDSCRGFDVHATEVIQVLDYYHEQQMIGSPAGHVMYCQKPTAPLDP
jgi:hypothetical protein